MASVCPGPVKEYLDPRASVKAAGIATEAGTARRGDSIVPDGVDVLTAYPRELRSLRAGTDMLPGETAKATKTGTSPISGRGIRPVVAAALGFKIQGMAFVGKGRLQ
jgi:hypothetical protein